MYSSDAQSEMKHGTPLPQSPTKNSDMRAKPSLSYLLRLNKPKVVQGLALMSGFIVTDVDAGGYPNEYELGKPTLIASTERLKIESLEIELSQLKWCCLYKLQQSLNQQNFPLAIAYIDSLVQRLPDDPDVRQWQATAYLRWGRQLRKKKDLKKAECCFNKALSVLPKNSSLHSEVQSDISRLCEFF